MRPFALALLLATAAATPALAAPEDQDRRADRQAEESETSKPRAERRTGPERADRPERTIELRRDSRREPRDLNAQTPTPTRPNLERREERLESPRERPAVIERIRERTREARGTDAPRPELRGEPADIRPSGDSVRDWRARDRRRDDSPTTIEERNLRRAPLGGGPGGDLVRPERPVPPVLDRDSRRVSRVPVQGTQPPAPTTATADVAEPRHRWRDDWRRDRRFDWRDHRRRHRSLFRLGFYYDPFGWDYYRHGIGWRMWPSYYGSNFWLRDPWMYRLPPAYGPYRWIRYHDDALLVNIYSGRVVDVIYDFFW